MIAEMMCQIGALWFVMRNNNQTEEKAQIEEKNSQSKGISFNG